MPSKEWSKLNNLQVGRYGEIYAMMEFLSYGMDVYPSEVDDHGVDMLVKSTSGRYHEIQIKTVNKSKYVIVDNKSVDDTSRSYYVCLLILEEGNMPEIFLIPRTAWGDTSTKLFVNREYEYGINISNKNMVLLRTYSFDKMIKEL